MLHRAEPAPPARLSSPAGLRLAGLLAAATLGASTAVVLVDAAGRHLLGLPGAGLAALSPAQLLTWLGAAAIGLVLGWVCLGSLLATLAQAPGRLGRLAARASGRITPLVLRTAVAAALGGSLAMTSISPAPAGPALPAPGWSAPLAPTAAGSGWGAPGRFDLPTGSSAAAATDTPSPDWTPGPPPSRPTTKSGDIGLVSAPPAAGRQVDEQVVVRLGDTLWEVAARHLGRDAGPAEIAQEWPRWYAANRSVIGHDPDLLLPGQRLTPPVASSASASSDHRNDR